MCLDTGHLYYAGMDPLDWLDRYYHRLDYLHFKDCRPRRFISALSMRVSTSSLPAPKGVMCPLGSGAADYPAVKAVLPPGYPGAG
ncbi:sugar phosphate isomerase/epimerase [Klebsiella pneumoniae subsp. pneumoniae]|nr:sugar phosphate isomerase/epimerase [Klebsiella pneumoniae subsp. pneumoniae]